MRCAILAGLSLLTGCDAIQAEAETGPIILKCEGTVTSPDPLVRTANDTLTFRIDGSKGSIEAWSGARWNRLGKGKAHIEPESIDYDSTDTDDTMTTHRIITIDRVTGAFSYDTDAKWTMNGKEGKMISNTSGNCIKADAPSDERKF